jgi:hypothetical protein
MGRLCGRSAWSIRSEFLRLGFSFEIACFSGAGCSTRWDSTSATPFTAIAVAAATTSTTAAPPFAFGSLFATGGCCAGDGCFGRFDSGALDGYCARRDSVFCRQVGRNRARYRAWLLRVARLLLAATFCWR